LGAPTPRTRVIASSGERGSVMLKRRHTRAAHKAKAITAERKLNDTYTTERG